MKKIIKIVLLIATTVANAQSDILIRESDTLNMSSNPLELKKNWNEIDQTISEQIEQYKLDSREDTLIEVLPWKDYKTEWQIRNDSLYLTRIISISNPKRDLDLHKIFETQRKIIFAGWVSDSIITFTGSCIICTGNHGNNTSIYADETVWSFEKGVLSGHTDHKNVISKKVEIWGPNEYQEYVYGNINWGEIPDMGDKIHQVTISIKPDQEGKLKEVDWENSYLLAGNVMIQDRENVFIKEAIRITKKVPDWDVVIRRGKIINQSITIIFSEEMKRKYGG